MRAKAIVDVSWYLVDVTAAETRHPRPPRVRSARRCVFGVEGGSNFTKYITALKLKGASVRRCAW